ncbi:MAG: response regulator [Candidatus Scalindua sp.]|nr:response regulator [Candidatus Scalindua sp.]MBT5307122.1 response regulator [Candidatus Scalindua sp.]MBT6051320.1 response regulator [Candidatus Scalindua sp.]MBT6563413.1 response regulator [Candidatus Scalindua sp.]MBT7212885.1 response regulator [Candidatus Scalindua sp.]
MSGEPVSVLLVEDNISHAELVILSFEEHRIANRIYHVSDGEEALDYLFRRGDYADPAKSPKPHVILLDLRLPKIDGLEVLKEIKTTTELEKIPTVVFTTSSAEMDVAKAYEYHANSYLIKPVDFEKFNQLMDDIGFYWLAWNYHPWDD